MPNRYGFKPISDDDLRRAGEELHKGKITTDIYLTNARMKAKEIEKDARANIKTSNVPSTRPDYSGVSASGSGGKEWGNHKYIDKVQTKSGKIRYIYEDVDTASGRHKNVAGDFRDKKLKKLKDIADAQERRQRADYYDKHPVEKGLKIAKDTVDNVAKAGKEFIDNTVKAFMDTPIGQLFKQ